LEAGTGVGKTVLSLALAHQLGVTTLIVVDQENIRRQWVDRIRQFLGLAESQIGKIQGDVCNYKGKPITVAMVHSLCKDGRYPAEMYSYFGLSVFDEVHVMGAETFNNVGFLVNSYWRLGLSATPDRKDGKDELFRAHIGEVLIRESQAPLVPKVILSASGWNCPTKNKQQPDGSWTKVKVPHSPGKCGHIVKSLTNAQIRTRLIANFTYQAYKKNRNIVIFSDLKDAYLPKIKQALVAQGVKLEDIGYYVGGMKDRDLKTASRRPVVLTTYKMTAKAVDCPWWDTAVLATPKSDIRQVLGRILREYPGKVNASQVGQGTIPIIFDIADLDSPIFKNYYKARLRYYREIGAPFGGDLRLLNLG
jgi:superfamily II DNA or RNA helicase